MVSIVETSTIDKAEFAESSTIAKNSLITKNGSTYYYKMKHSSLAHKIANGKSYYFDTNSKE